MAKTIEAKWDHNNPNLFIIEDLEFLETDGVLNFNAEDKVIL